MIEVINPGVYTSIQDGVRKGYRHFGVPCSGFMDEYSAGFANALLGFEAEAPLIEVAHSGLELKFHESTVIVLCGADVKALVNSKRISLNRLSSIKAGTSLKIESCSRGVWTYLGIGGTLMVEQTLGSASQFNSITRSARLSRGDHIPFQSAQYSGVHHSRLKHRKDQLFKKQIEVFKGPEFDLLTEDDREVIFGSSFTLKPQSNRMAYTFKKDLSAHTHSILTSPVLPGTMQWTPSGKMFCLMRDAQTTGGYPRILQLKEEDISALAQKQSGEEIKFKLIR